MPLSDTVSIEGVGGDGDGQADPAAVGRVLGRVVEQVADDLLQASRIALHFDARRAAGATRSCCCALVHRRSVGSDGRVDDAGPGRPRGVRASVCRPPRATASTRSPTRRDICVTCCSTMRLHPRQQRLVGRRAAQHRRRDADGRQRIAQLLRHHGQQVRLPLPRLLGGGLQLLRGRARPAPASRSPRADRACRRSCSAACRRSCGRSDAPANPAARAALRPSTGALPWNARPPAR